MGCDALCGDMWNKPYKIFTYIDSVGCTGCRLGLSKWTDLMDSCNVRQWDVGFLFVVHSNNYDKLEGVIKSFEFDYPVIYDYHNDFEKLNCFPPEPYSTFLLDKNNKVQLVGSPIDNPKMWELYKSLIARTE
jgi:hypothetical protein